MQSGERQSGRMRTLYLQAMLNQDVGFFDIDISTGEILNRISSDTALVQDAISEKVCVSHVYAACERHLIVTVVKNTSQKKIVTQYWMHLHCAKLCDPGKSCDIIFNASSF